MAAGNHMRDSEGRIDNYWRVIYNGGSVPANFRASTDRGPKDSYSAMQRLMKEGVWFDANGLAIPSQFFSYEEWMKISQRHAPAVEAAADERDDRIVAEVNQGGSRMGRRPLTADQRAEMLSRLTGERAARS